MKSIKKSNYFGLIMAGGIGSRFWPVSTKENPKQFHDMLGTGRSLIKQTYDRLVKLIPEENILVATNILYKDIVLKELPGLKEDQVILEPAMRNTAPCILYSALKINQKNPDAVMIVAPSDHHIDEEELFVDNVRMAFENCEQKDILMTLGIRPTYPNTGYGYIRYEESQDEVKKVLNFTEKPDIINAMKFIKQGDYLWNAGIFIWRTKSILSSYSNLLPVMNKLFTQNKEWLNSGDEARFIDENYGNAENISIDYGILEKAENVYVLPVGFGWNDLGTWGALYNKLDKDANNNAVVNASTYCEDSTNNMISMKASKKVVLKGLTNYIIVDSDDTLMIIPRASEQDIKEISAKAEGLNK